MKEIATRSHTDIQKYHKNANWYSATPLIERITSLQGHTAENPSTALSNSEIAKQRLQRWKEQIPFNKDAAYFVQRLTQDGATEENLFVLLAEPIEAVQARASTPPLWLTELLNAFEEYGADVLPLPETTEKRTIAFLTTLQPLLQSRLMRLRAGIQELALHYVSLPFDAETVIPLLFAHVPALILPKLLRTIVLELNVARVQGRLQGETAEERFQYFLHLLANPDGMLPLLEEYAVLARQLVETLDRWIVFELELLARLCADWETICSTFTQGRDLGVLVEVQAGKGDTHRHGRSVTILRWSSGFRLVYKPRSVTIDVHFQELLTWLNAIGYQPGFRTLRIIDKETYGWVEFVQPVSCSTAEEIERFYQRQGGYLALLYALEAGDFHAENLIAAGEYPMLIDLEALFQPRVSMQASTRQEYPGLETMDRSVLRIGLLPQRLWSTEQGEGVDVSGLGGHSGQLTPMPVPQWAEAGTDLMRIRRERIAMEAGQNRPKLQDQEVNTLEYCDSIIAGFTATYRLLLQHRDELLTDMLPRFVEDEIRCVLRATHTYGMLLSDSFHPNVLRDALERDRLFDRLWADIVQKPFLARVIAAERNDLLNGDIPVFITRPDSRDLFTWNGEKIGEFFDRSALDGVRMHMQRFDEQDLEKQVWVIRASFTSMALGTEKATLRILQLKPSTTEVTYDRLITAAHAIGDRLGKLALHSEETVGWLGVTPVNEHEWHLLPTDVDLYSGTSGIALFLGYLGILTGMERHTTLAKLALNSARYQVMQQKQRPGSGGIGAFNGLGAYIYLLSQLGTIWNDPTLFQEAVQIVQLLPDIIGDDQMFDVIGGAAGCIAALLSLYAVAPSKTILKAAVQCGDHLITSARPLKAGIGWSIRFEEMPLAGFSHGNAGIALNLLRLYDVTGEERFRQAGIAAIEYERSLFVPERGNWPDLRNLVSSRKAEEETSYMVAWCHGASGIGLARLGALHILNDAAMYEEIEAALQTTISEGFGINHSLCHGDMGNLDILLTAAQVLKQTNYERQIRRLAPMLLDSIEQKGWVTGIPQGVETPGLMAGIAGIGYALLRLAAPEQVPSVLLLAPPL